MNRQRKYEEVLKRGMAGAISYRSRARARNLPVKRKQGAQEPKGIHSTSYYWPASDLCALNVTLVPDLDFRVTTQPFHTTRKYTVT